MKLTISRGEQVIIWHDPWIPNTILSKSSLTIDYEHCDLRYTLDYHFLNGNWRIDLIQSYGQNLCDIITAIPIDTSLSHDKFGWGDDYAIRPRVADIIFQEFYGDQIPSWTHIYLWKIAAPQKRKFFLWKLLKGRISVGALMGISGRNPFCPFCAFVDETIPHMLFDCPHARSVWSRIHNRWPRVRWPTSVDDIKNWF